MALELQGVTRFFGGIPAADRVDLTIEDGELRCLIGPNGAGKSTLFKLVMGLERLQAGSIRLGDREVGRLQPFERVHVGLNMTYQATRVFAGLTLAQNITVARHDRDGGNGLMAWALSRFGFTEHLERPAGTLSYGEQRWLEMCLVLGTAPRILLLDEPTAGMTPEETEVSAAFIQELNAKGLGIVVIEHDIGFVKAVARRVTVLHQGRVFREGTIGEIEDDVEVQRIYLGERRD